MFWGQIVTYPPLITHVPNRGFCRLLPAMSIRAVTRWIDMCQREHYKEWCRLGLRGQQCDKV